jgi:hypothetical protein
MVGCCGKVSEKYGTLPKSRGMEGCCGKVSQKYGTLPKTHYQD